MSGKIRVFISSTMKDLPNERDAVARKIAAFNFEPVNAEAWTPTGASSWEKIREEIRSSHLFVVLSGEKYGWVPDQGYGADTGLSVTHLEYNEAKAMELAILPFFKELSYDSPREGEDARKRDAFRKEVSSWNGGRFISTFDLAYDLSEKVAAALVGVLSETYLQKKVNKRNQDIHSASPSVKSASPNVAEELAPYYSNRPPVVIPPDLLAAIGSGNLLLMAGSGISISAGMPSAIALTNLFASRISAKYQQDHSDFTGTFQEVTENFITLFGRSALHQLLQTALTLPNIQPTSAHYASVKLFRTILTTNYDNLFEQAFNEYKIPYQLVKDGKEIPPGSPVNRLIKMDGSLNDPESLVYTYADGWNFRQEKKEFWEYIKEHVNTHPMLIVGHSLRDANSNELIRSRNKTLPAWVVISGVRQFDADRYGRLSLQVIDSGADDFFRRLTS